MAAPDQAPSMADMLAEFSVSHTWEMLAVMTTITVLGAGIPAILKQFSERRAAQFAALPIYLTVLPGVTASVVLAYLLFFTNENLFRLSGGWTLILPPFWMLGSLFLFSKLVDFEAVPGFERLRGLFGVAILSLVTLLILDRFRILVIFYIGPLGGLIAFFILFVAFKLALRKAFASPPPTLEEQLKG
ncbi:MAG: hypothetical protein P1V97_24795 [Planctomycetota bacterium]|nr:hypothetical protein [Planctomycetota bacterium]